MWFVTNKRATACWTFCLCEVKPRETQYSPPTHPLSQTGHREALKRTQLMYTSDRVKNILFFGLKAQHRSREPWTFKQHSADTFSHQKFTSFTCRDSCLKLQTLLVDGSFEINYSYQNAILPRFKAFLVDPNGNTALGGKSACLWSFLLTVAAHTLS